LLKANQFDVPAGLIENEVKRLQQLNAAGGQGGAVEPAQLQTRARTRVALGLILAEIVRARSMRPDAAQVRARIEEMAADYDAPQKFIEWYYASPERLGEVESLVLEERIVEELLAGAQINDRALGFQELLSQESGIQ
jgi:trigger factor